MKRIFLFLSLVACSLAVLAQKTLVKGSVTDTDGEPLMGANVVVNNTKLGVITSTEGKFELLLDAQKSHELSISYMGFEGQVIELIPPLNRITR